VVGGSESLGQRALAWIAELRSLPDNPVAHYLQLGRARRLAPLPWWRRRAAPLALTAACLATVAVITVNDPPDGALQWLLVLAIASALPFLATGLLVELAATAADLFDLLGSGARRYGLKLDDMLALSSLTDRQIVAGALMAAVRPVLPWLWGLAVLAWAVVLLVNVDGGAPDSLAVLQVIVLAPATVLSIGCTGSLALLVLFAAWTGLGRGLRAGTAGAALLLLMLGQLLWWIAELWAQNTVERADPQWAPWMPPLAVLLAVLLSTWGLALAREARIARIALAAAGPALPVLVVLGLGISWVAADETMAAYTAAPIFLIELGWALGAFVPFNLHAIATPLCWGGELSADSLGSLPLFEWFRLPLLLAAQLALLLLALEFSRDEVRRRRSSV
jgi:hypothetical protein